MARIHSTARRRKRTTLLLALPAIATAALWIASHFWYLWYCSLPPGTTVSKTFPPFPPAVKLRILAGGVHYTDDQAYRASTAAGGATGSMSLGTGYDGRSGIADSGINIRWSPYGFSATRWKPEFNKGNWGFPLALPLAIFLIPPALYWFFTRPKPGACPNCGYNRAGLAKDAKCPECGAVA